MATTECIYSGGGGVQGFSKPVKISNPPAGTDIPVSGKINKIITFAPFIPEVAIWEDGVITFAIENGTLIENPTTSQMNQYPSYANDVITINSDSSQSRDVWYMYC